MKMLAVNKKIEKNRQLSSSKSYIQITEPKSNKSLKSLISRDTKLVF